MGFVLLLLLFSILILYQSSICFCFDVVLDRSFFFGNDYLDNLQRDGLESNVLQQISDDNGPAKNQRTEHLKSPDEMYKTDNAIESYQLKGKENKQQEKSKKTTIFTNRFSHERKLIHDIKTQILTEGDKTLKTVANKITKYLNLTLDIDAIIQNVSESYVVDINEHIDYVGKQNVNSDIEREFYILDIIESSNKVFSHMCKKIFKRVMVRLTHQPHIEHNKYDKILLKLMHEVIIEEKNNNLKYICEELHICRCFPSYTDHVARILEEIVKLSDEKVEITVKQLKDIIGNNMTKFMNTIIDDDTKDIISSQLNPIVDHVPAARSFLTTLQQVISQRFKIYRSKDGEIEIRKKSVRILIDMIDKAFEVLENDLIDVEFDIVLNGIKTWAKGSPFKNSFKIILKDYCQNLGDVLRFYWSSDTKEEAKVLIEVIATGRPKYEIQTFDELFSKGSKFVRDIEP